MVEYVPDRGDVVWLDFEPQAGREIKKKRPALVVSLKQYNKKTSLALFMPITSQIKGYPFEVVISSKDVEGAILADQIRSLDWRARKAKKIASLPTEIVKDALSKVQLLLE